MSIAIWGPIYSWGGVGGLAGYGATPAGQTLPDTLQVLSFDGTTASIAITINGAVDVTANLITGTARGERRCGIRPTPRSLRQRSYDEDENGGQGKWHCRPSPSAAAELVVRTKLLPVWGRALIISLPSGVPGDFAMRDSHALRGSYRL